VAAVPEGIETLASTTPEMSHSPIECALASPSAFWSHNPRVVTRMGDEPIVKSYPDVPPSDVPSIAAGSGLVTITFPLSARGKVISIAVRMTLVVIEILIVGL
jgi:hypothetical protein